MSNIFQAQFQITGIAPAGTGRWFCQAEVNFFGPASYGFDTSSIQVGDSIILQSSSPSGQTNKFIVDTIDSVVDINTIQLHFTYNDTGTIPAAVSTGTGLITKLHPNSFLGVPSDFWCQVDEFLPAYINTKNAEAIKNPNAYIQGQSGFEAHELDGTNNDINSYIEWNNTDQTHYHRVEPKADGQDLDIKIGFQFPSQFTGLRNAIVGNAFEFYGKADNGSTDSVNTITLVSLVDTDGTEYAVSGKQITSTGRTLVTLNSTEVLAALNPTTSSSSSSSSTREWGATDAGAIIYARFKLFGNLGDNVYLDSDNVFMFIA